MKVILISVLMETLQPSQDLPRLNGGEKKNDVADALPWEFLGYFCSLRFSFRFLHFYGWAYRPQTCHSTRQMRRAMVGKMRILGPIARFLRKINYFSSLIPPCLFKYKESRNMIVYKIVKECSKETYPCFLWCQVCQNYW
jgi:hypothetical protein